MLKVRKFHNYCWFAYLSRNKRERLNTQFGGRSKLTRINNYAK